MTNKEALEILQKSTCTLDHDALQVAIETLKNADYYSWHDIKADPSDLPTEDDPNDVFLCCIDGGNYDYGYACLRYGFDGTWEKTDIMDNDSEVIAWKEIAEFLERHETPEERRYKRRMRKLRER